MLEKVKIKMLATAHGAVDSVKPVEKFVKDKVYEVPKHLAVAFIHHLKVAVEVKPEPPKPATPQQTKDAGKTETQTAKEAAETGKS